MKNYPAKEWLSRLCSPGQISLITSSRRSAVSEFPQSCVAAADLSSCHVAFFTADLLRHDEMLGNIADEEHSFSLESFDGNPDDIRAACEEWFPDDRLPRYIVIEDFPYAMMRSPKDLLASPNSIVSWLESLRQVAEEYDAGVMVTARTNTIGDKTNDSEADDLGKVDINEFVDTVAEIEELDSRFRSYAIHVTCLDYSCEFLAFKQSFVGSERGWERFVGVSEKIDDVKTDLAKAMKELEQEHRAVESDEKEIEFLEKWIKGDTEELQYLQKIKDTLD